MRWLDSITDSMDMNSGKFWETVTGRPGMLQSMGHKEPDTTWWLNNNKKDPLKADKQRYAGQKDTRNGRNVTWLGCMTRIWRPGGMLMSWHRWQGRMFSMKGRALMKAPTEETTVCPRKANHSRGVDPDGRKRKGQRHIWIDLSDRKRTLYLIDRKW